MLIFIPVFVIGLILFLLFYKEQTFSSRVSLSKYGITNPYVEISYFGKESGDVSIEGNYLMLKGKTGELYYFSIKEEKQEYHFSYEYSETGKLTIHKEAY